MIKQEIIFFLISEYNHELDKQFLFHKLFNKNCKKCKKIFDKKNKLIKQLEKYLDATNEVKK